MKKQRFSSLAILTMLMCSIITNGFAVRVTAAEQNGTAFYVAVNGNDANKGTIDSPFASLEAARDAIKEMKNSGGLPAGGVTVYIRGGEYHFQSTFRLGQQDSGTKEAPVIYKAYADEKPIFTGGSTIDFSKSVNVTNSGVLSRLPKESSDKVVQIDLKAQGVTEYGELTDYGFSMWHFTPPRSSVIHPLLFLENDLMTQARYPNDGEFSYVSNVVDGGSTVRYWKDDVKLDPLYVPLEKRDSELKGPVFEYDEDRPSRWTQAKDIWLYGYWYWDWADQTLQVDTIDVQKKTIKAKGPSSYGIRSGQRYYAFNLLEEIDVPGEYYLDRNAGMLYVYPTTSNREARMTLCTANFNMIQLENTSFVSLEGITIEGTKGRGIIANNCSDGVFNRITVSKIGDEAISVQNGKNFGITNCHVYAVAKGAISLSGGDRPTLTPGNCYLENNYIHDIGMVQKTFVIALGIHGVGNRAAYNEIHDCPFLGISFGGNDNIIEYNRIYRVSQGSDDNGAICTGRNWTERGNIIRYNYVHDLQGLGTGGRAGVRAVMLDDMASGSKIYGNIFVNIQSAISINGGRDNEVENNIFVNCGVDGKPTIYIGDWGIFTDEGHLHPETGTFFLGLKEVPYQNELWSQRYPQLAKLLSDNYKEPRYNVIQRNLLVKCKQLAFGATATQYGTIKDNIYTNDDPGFVDAANLNYNLKADASIYSQLPSFEKLPFDKMGLSSKQKIYNAIALKAGSSIAYVNKEPKMLDPDNEQVKAIVKDGRTLVPVRFISESYGAKVDWNESTSEVTVEYGGRIIKMTLGSQKYTVDNAEKTLDTPAQTINGRTMIPLRAMVEAIGKKVFWDDIGLILISDRESILDSQADHGLIRDIAELFNVPSLSKRAKAAEAVKPPSVDAKEIFSFEKAPLGFELSEVTISTEQKHSGEKSVKFDKDTGSVSRKYPVARNNVVTIWIYDSGTSDVRVMARVDDGGSWRGMGISTNQSADFYVIRDSNDYTAPFTITKARRTKGWHKFQWDYTSTTRVDYYIDGQKVGLTEGIGAFDSIVINDLWGEGWVSNIFVDDIEVSNSLTE